MIKTATASLLVFAAGLGLAQAAQPQLPSVELPLTLDRGQQAQTQPPVEPIDGNTAFAAYQTGHYYKALDAALKRVETVPEDVAALTLLGELYRQGLGVPADAEQAVDWYSAAVRKGDVQAVMALALMKLEGEGTPKDVQGAAKLFEEAAAKGNVQAHYNLGMLRLEGNGIPADTAKAAEHFRLAAEAGNHDAQYAYATMMGDGRLGAPNPGGAAEWLRKAADQGNTDAEIEFAIALFNGKGIQKNEDEAARYFEKAAHKGNPIAENRLARLYATGRGVAGDPVRAMAWHLLAESAGLKDGWLDNFVRSLPEETRRLGYLQAQQWRGVELLALDGSRPSGQTTGQTNSIAPEVKP